MENNMPDISTYPILYGLSSKGVVKVWTIWVERKVDSSVIFTKHGQMNGKMQISHQTVTEGKNIGRSNETDHFVQACLEAESKLKKQYDKNYSEVVPKSGEGTDEQDNDGSSVGGSKLLPMLAQKFNERKKYIQWPAFVQPKLNGVRCLVERKGDNIFYWSRKGKIYKNFSLYMNPQFLSFMKDGEILDGEMYNHGDLTFQQLISAIKDEKTPDIDTLKKHVHFHCYDRASSEGGFKKRYILWHGKLPNSLNVPYLSFVKTVVVLNETEMKAMHGIFVEQGYEGSIVRSDSNDAYRFQYRDNQLQKYKDFVDEEFEIVGCKDGRGKDEHKAIFRCQTSSKTGGVYGDGTFDVRCKATMVEREEQWNNRKSYMGKQLTVRYQTLSDEGIPIFPVGIAVRDYE